MASDMGNTAYANIYLLGKLIQVRQMVTLENFEKALYEILPAKKHSMIPEEMEILKIGMNY
jgi:2-oxoglutarate ferredoxin oxidoreductase subunit gamma